MAATSLGKEEIDELRRLGAAHFWPHARMAGDMSPETGIQLVARAEGVWVEDVSGKRWFDTFSGMALKNVGHGRKEIAKAVYEQLQTLYEHRIVGDIRGGMGLLCGIELVTDRDTRESFPSDAGLAKKLEGIMAKRGLLGMILSDSIVLAPPLCVTKDEVDYLVTEVDGAIGELEGVLRD